MHFNLETVANVTLSFGDTLLIRNNFGNVLTITTELRQQSGDHCTHFCSTVTAQVYLASHVRTVVPTMVSIRWPLYPNPIIRTPGAWIFCPIISVQFSYGVPWRQTNLLTSFSSKVWPKGGWGAADSKVGGQVNNLGGQEYHYYHYYCCYSNLNKSELPRGQSSLPCVGILIMPEHPWLTNLVSAQYSAQTKVTPGTKYFLHTKIPFSRIVILTRCLGQSKMPVWLVSFKFKRRRCWQGWPPAMIFYWRQ